MTAINILLVEDNPHDAILVREALMDSAIAHSLTVASDGDRALQILYSAEVRPHLILLDINLPKKSGIEVLKEIKRDRALCLIPVIMLTNSRSEDDVVKSYGYHCNAYVRKPLGFEGLLEVLSIIMSFWFTYATLPKQDDMAEPPSSIDPSLGSS